MFNNEQNMQNIGENFRRNLLTDEIIRDEQIYTDYFVDFTYTIDATNIAINIGEVSNSTFNRLRNLYINVWVFAYDPILLHSNMGDEINYNVDEIFGKLEGGDIFLLSKPQASFKIDSTGFSHSTTVLNEGTSFQRTYAQDKLVFIYQITLYPKNLNDPLDNHETNFYYRVY